jgi:CubicO group peptidase (beta-lactamase class C family)
MKVALMESQELMRGFPPEPGTQVTLGNWRRAPFNKWSFQHVREIVPSADIPNDPDSVWGLPEKLLDLSDLVVRGSSAEMDFQAFLDATDTDGIAILHRGAVACEIYRSGMSASTPHILMSVSKSVLGLLAGILADQGVLDLRAPVTDSVPELASSAYRGATIRDLLDMRAGILFDEDYLATSGPIIEYRKAQNWDPLAPGDPVSDLRSFLASLTETDGEHDDLFHYVSPNTDLLGWVIERTTGRRYADLVSELLWRPLGASRSAYITVDRLGAPRCAGGMCTTTLDLARLGQLIAQSGARDGRPIIPSWWIDDIYKNGSRGAWDAGDFAKYLPGTPVHYRSKWYVLNGDAPMMFGIGVFGQNVFVDPVNEIVIAKFSSQAGPMDESRILLTMQGVAAIRERLSESG